MSQHNATRTTPRTAAPPALGLALLVIATAQLMLVLDDTIVNVALPSMQRSLHIARLHLNWVVSFYALAFGGLLLAGGRRRRPFGRLRMFRPGSSCSRWPRWPRVRAERDGAARRPHRAGLRRRDRRARRAVPAGHHLPGRAGQDQGLGVYGAMAGLGSVVGLLLGGTLTEYLSWRWVLFINVPIAVGGAGRDRRARRRRHASTAGSTCRARSPRRWASAR